MRVEARGVRDVRVSMMKFAGVRIQGREMTDEEMWKRILEGPYQPAKCPGCGSDLDLAKMELKREIETDYDTGQYQVRVCVTQWGQRVDLEFSCPKCHADVRGKGIGIRFDSNSLSFTIEELVLGMVSYHWA